MTNDEVLKQLNLERWRKDLKIVSSRFMGQWAILESVFEKICSCNPQWVNPSKRAYLIEVPEETYVFARQALELLRGLRRIYGETIEDLPLKEQSEQPNQGEKKEGTS